MKNDLINYGLGSITNGTYKVEVRITNFSGDSELFEKGDNIEVEGILKFTSKFIIHLKNSNNFFRLSIFKNKQIHQ